MGGEEQRVAGVWMMLILSFVIMAGFLYLWNQPISRFAAFYWFPVAVMTVSGILPPPWKVLTGSNLE